MNDKSAGEIEREVEETRSEVNRTVEALRAKMTPGQMLDEAMGALRDSGGGEMVKNLGAQVRDNPLPLALIGAGVAWLMMGPGVRREPAAYTAYDTYEGYADREGRADGDSDGEGLTDRVRHGAERASGAVSAARESVSSSGAHAADSARALSQRASARSHAARDQAARSARKVQRSFLDTLDQEPLVIGALGIAVGAALGAAIPTTEAEDRYLGPLRDRALDEGRARAEEGLQRAEEVAAATYEDAKGELRDQQSRH